jgi:hypothetical protein
MREELLRLGMGSSEALPATHQAGRRRPQRPPQPHSEALSGLATPCAGSRPEAIWTLARSPRRRTRLPIRGEYQSFPHGSIPKASPKQPLPHPGLHVVLQVSSASSHTAASQKNLVRHAILLRQRCVEACSTHPHPAGGVPCDHLPPGLCAHIVGHEVVWGMELRGRAPAHRTPRGRVLAVGAHGNGRDLGGDTAGVQSAQVKVSIQSAQVTG